MFEKEPIWMIVRDLQAIKLPKRDRAFILEAAKTGPALLSHKDTLRVRRIAERNRSKVIGLRLARDRSRQSQAKVQGVRPVKRVESADRVSSSGFGF